MRTNRSATAENRTIFGAHRVVVLCAVVLLAITGALPATAEITSVSPGSAHVLPGTAAGVNVTTDASVVGVTGAHSGITVAPKSGTGPTVHFTFTALTSASPGSYSYSFFDDAGGGGSFTLIVDTPPATTTTTTQPPTTTTTTRAPATTTTRATTTTTTRAPATTTTTTTSSTTTTTTAPSTTTSSTTTTTTAPVTTTTTTAPSTTTSSTTTTTTLVPAGLAAFGGDDGGSGIPSVWFGGGIALLAIALLALLAFLSRRRPTYGAATLGPVLAWQRRSERRRVSRQTRPSRAGGFGRWWRVSGPMVFFHDWRSSRQASQTVQRQIEDRKRLRRQDD